jgi:hypothetical protein
MVWWRDHPPGPNVRSLYMKITCSGRATVQTIGYHRPDAAHFRKDFQRNFWNFSRTVVCPDGLWLQSRRRLVFIKLDANLNRQPINWGPKAWEQREFGIEFHSWLESYIMRLLSWVDLSKVVAVCSALNLKSILGVGPKVNDSIEDPFR